MDTKRQPVPPLTDENKDLAKALFTEIFEAIERKADLIDDAEQRDIFRMDVRLDLMGVLTLELGTRNYFLKSRSLAVAQKLVRDICSGTAERVCGLLPTAIEENKDKLAKMILAELAGSVGGKHGE